MLLFALEVSPLTATPSDWDRLCSSVACITSHQGICTDLCESPCAQIDWAKAHMGHVNPNYGKLLKSQHNTNHWCRKDPKSLKTTQFGAVGGQMWSFGGEN
eukprot:1160727-Pelagomonas_calceolata.AAC.10